MRSVIHGGWVIVLAACGGGGASSATNRASSTAEHPQVVAARAKRDAVCACTDAPCVAHVLDGPLGREVEGPPIEDPATLRLKLTLGQDTLDCLYRISGVPAACLAMVRVANALTLCPALTDAQSESLAEKVQGTTDAWHDVEWSTLSAAQVGEHERACEATAAAIRGLTQECAPQEQPPGPK